MASPLFALGVRMLRICNYGVLLNICCLFTTSTYNGREVVFVQHWEDRICGFESETRKG